MSVELSHRFFDGILCGYAAERRVTKGVCVLQAYVDDSSSPGGEHRLWLAGYIMAAEKWKPFSDDWAEALAAPPRKLPSLHMAGGFHGWSARDRQRKLVQLAAVIEKYRPMSIECSVSKRDFDALVKPVAAYDVRHAYFACFHGLIFQAAQMIGEAGLSGPLDFVFDEQGRVGTDAVDFYHLMKQTYPDRIRSVLGGPPIFRDDEKILPLQAADMIAWHRRAISRPDCKHEARVIAERIIFRHGVAEIPKAMLEDWAKRFAQIPGIAQARHPKASIRKTVAKLSADLPPERLIPAMEAISARGERLLRLKNVLERVGLRRVWKWLSKRPIKVR